MLLVSSMHLEKGHSHLCDCADLDTGYSHFEKILPQPEINVHLKIRFSFGSFLLDFQSFYKKPVFECPFTHPMTLFFSYLVNTCYWPAERSVWGKTVGVTEMLKMLPEEAGRGQYFQAGGHSFSLYRPTLSRPITCLSFSPCGKLAYKWVCLPNFITMNWLTRRLQTIPKKSKGRYTRGSSQHAPATRSRSKAPSSASMISSEKYVAQQNFCSRVLLPHIKLV